MRRCGREEESEAGAEAGAGAGAGPLEGSVGARSRLVLRLEWPCAMCDDS